MITRSPQFDDEHARRWQDMDAAESYQFRAPYPPETFEILLGLIVDQPSAILDIGCGTGDFARALAPRVGRVDAIDLSAEMVAVGQRRPGGNHPNICWTVSRAEDASIDGPYALIVGGQSLHWMDFELLLPRFANALTPNGMLAVARGSHADARPWDAPIAEVVARYSTNQNYVPFPMIEAWEERALLERIHEVRTAPVLFDQSIEECLSGFHAMSTLTRAHIDAPAFDAEVRSILREHCPDGIVRRGVVGELVWGRPGRGPR